MWPSKIKMDEEKSKHVILTILHPKYFVQAILLLLVEMLLARTTLSVGSTTQGRKET
jgi:hypothetical protein